MGGDLPAPVSKAPSFVVWAERDPSFANLDRVQIIKGWARNGQSFEKIYDVAWAGDRKPDAKTGKLPAIGSTVDIAKGSYTNTIGSSELTTVWSDPDFDPGLDAFYYARALLIPTPRWTTIQAAEAGVVPPEVVPLTVQDRAWSLPIWYTPSVEVRKAAKPGVTVAELKQKGAVALDDAQLKEKVVGKTVQVRNAVTGRRFEIVYGTGGQRLVTSVDGQIKTHLNGTPFDIVVYRLGDEHFASRSDEFGYANYEVAF